MIPLVATAPELSQMRAELEPVATEILEREEERSTTSSGAR